MKPLFKIGDKVITNFGEKGKIIYICLCDKCHERGFYEPLVKFEDGHTEYISIYQFNNNFKDFYSIGKHIYGNLCDITDFENTINETEMNLKQLKKQLKTLKKIKGE